MLCFPIQIKYFLILFLNFSHWPEVFWDVYCLIFKYFHFSFIFWWLIYEFHYNKKRYFLWVQVFQTCTVYFMAQNMVYVSEFSCALGDNVCSMSDMADLFSSVFSFYRWNVPLVSGIPSWIVRIKVILLW